MNGKKAKRLRQLVNVLQEKKVIDPEWRIDGYISHECYNYNTDIFRSNTQTLPQPPTISKQSVLKPECGKAVYKQMKKRTINENL